MDQWVVASLPSGKPVSAKRKTPVHTLAKADCYIQRQELAACQTPHPLDYRYEPDFVDGLNLKLIAGDQEILPGIALFLMSGHTQGGQTVRVNTANGKVIIPAFCCNKENFPAEGRTAVCPGVHCDAYQAYDAAQAVKAVDGLILPLHELAVATAIPVYHLMK